MPDPVLEQIQFEPLLDEVAEGVYIVDRERRILYWNSAAERITGYPEHEVVTKLCHSDLLMHCDETGKVLCGSGCPLAATIADGMPRDCSVFVRHRHGHRVGVDVHARPARNAAGEVVGAIEFFEPSAAQAREYVTILGTHGCLDEVTGLANRAYGEWQAKRELALLQRFGMPFGWIRLELRSTEKLIRRYGHGVLDAARFVVARTLEASVAPQDLLADWAEKGFRVGTHPASEEKLGELGWKLRALTQASSLEWWGDPLSLAVSVGITPAAAGDTLETLEARAAEEILEIK